MASRNAHCSSCGARFAEGLAWPRTCATCGQTSYRNPLPVALLLLPVDDGLLLIRRGDPPIGALALPGGYVDHGETWQEAAARELGEEASVRVSPAEVKLFDVLTAREGFVLIFGIANPRRAAELSPFVKNAEIEERVVVRATPAAMAFSLHAQVVRAFFGGKRGMR
jgi:ADP-ribose pyrophosphatase YjhB (NUDIX family)